MRDDMGLAPVQPMCTVQSVFELILYHMTLVKMGNLENQFLQYGTCKIQNTYNQMGICSINFVENGTSYMRHVKIDFVCYDTCHLGFYSNQYCSGRLCTIHVFTVRLFSEYHRYILNFVQYPVCNYQTC